MTLNNIPPGWTSWSSLVPQTNGKSGAIVYRAGAGHFIKSELISPLAKLPGEVARLRWLSSIGLPCPEVVDALDHGDRHWLLMTAVPGRDLASTDDLAAETAVTLVAQALRMLHDVDPEICPFDHRSAVRAAAATANLQAGLYDGDDPSFGPASHERLLATRPINEDLVVTHGDAKFPNFMARDGRFTGSSTAADLASRTDTRISPSPAAASSATSGRPPYPHSSPPTVLPSQMRRSLRGTICSTSFSRGIRLYESHEQIRGKPI